MTGRGIAKSTALILGGFALLVFLAVIGINAAFSYFTPRIEKTVLDASGRHSIVMNHIGLGLQGFRPALVVKNVELGAPGPVITLGRLSVTLPLHFPGKGDDPWAIFANFNNIRIDGKSYGDYGVPIRFLPGGFEAPDIKGRLGDSTLEGHIRFLDRKLDVDLKLRDLDYSRIAEGVTGGHTNVDIVLKGRGDTEEAVLKSLDGHVRLIGDKGRMLGGAADLWAGDLLSSVLAGPEKETRLNCAVADFDIRHGVARSKTTIIDTQRVTVSGAGTIDLVQGRMDMRFTPAPKSPSLINLATPVTVSGPFGAVETVPDPGSVATKMGGLLLGAINPAAMLLPMIETGAANRNPCAAYLDKKDAQAAGKGGTP
ncbi:MAG: hypothetical protein GC185_05295 [Alphaproteobacteria bacterium]|nr:hypothetical protein [Alphaproteobacteria bacterium]